MLYRSWRFGLSALAFCSGLAVGCSSTVAQQQKPPPDPLLWSKKSVAGKPPAPDARESSARLDAPSPLSGRETALTVELGEPAPLLTMQLPHDTDR